MKILKDVVTNIPVGELPHALRGRVERMRTLRSRISDSLPRTNEAVALANLVKRTEFELENLSCFLPDRIEAVAWSTRNILELSLVVRHILRDEKNMGAWLGQCIGDERDVIEGVLGLDSDNAKARVVLAARLEELKSISERFQIDSHKPFKVIKLAEDEGMTDEYNSFFKIFSKYVHPSSYIINSPDGDGFFTSADALNIFVIHAQLYAEDIYLQATTWLTMEIEKLSLAKKN